MWWHEQHTAQCKGLKSIVQPSELVHSDPQKGVELQNHYMAAADVKDVKPAQSAEPLVQTSELAHLTNNV